MKHNKFKYRMAIQFDTNDPRQRDAINFLGLCGYQKNKLIGIMVHEFLTKYNFDDADEKQIKNFINSYHFIRGLAEKSANSAPLIVSSQPATEPEVDSIVVQKPDKTEIKNKKPRSASKVKQENDSDNSSISTESIVNDAPAGFDKDKASSVLSAFGI